MSKKDTELIFLLVVIILIVIAGIKFWPLILLIVCLYLVITGLISCGSWSQVKKISNHLVNEHMEALVRKRAQTVRTDDYGNSIHKKWKKEVIYFINNVIAPRLSRHQYKSLFKETNINYVANKIIEKKVHAAQIKREKSSEFRDSMSPTDFEYFCANELDKQGWKAQVTKGSGDQGVDIIAEKNGTRVVMQCKKYTKVVGNKAVQEIVAGRKYEHAQIACVISNSSFTKGAKELAAVNGVHLLHYYDLSKIDKIVANK